MHLKGEMQERELTGSGYNSGRESENRHLFYVIVISSKER